MTSRHYYRCLQVYENLRLVFIHIDGLCINGLWLVKCRPLPTILRLSTILKPIHSPRGRVLSATILVMLTLCMPFLQGLDFNDWLWIGVMLNITVLRNEVSWRNCFNGLDKYIDLRKDFRNDFIIIKYFFQLESSNFVSPLSIFIFFNLFVIGKDNILYVTY